jgi:hypothetical protein
MFCGMLRTAGKGILEDLLEAQELEDGQVDCGVESKTTLVGAESRVELHTVAIVDLAFALVVLPDDTELDDALGDGGDLEGLLVLGVLVEERRRLEGGDELWRECISGMFGGVDSKRYAPLRACSNSGSDIVVGIERVYCLAEASRVVMRRGGG